jgi:DNA polymerase family A
MILFDTETCGFHGPIVLLQWAEGIDGPIHLHSVWKEPIGATLDLFDKIIYDPEGIIGFNIVYDWFHVCQMYTTLILISRDKWDDPPDIEEYALLEEKGRFGPCIKPTAACDLMLHARKGPYQSTMNRDDIRIKRVPTPLAWQLADELEKRIVLKGIYFAKKKDKVDGRRWGIYDIEDRNGKMNPDFKDLVLKFAPSSALKALAVDALGIDPQEVLTFKDVDLPSKVFPKELGYAPFATAIGKPGAWNGSWPDFIRHHISHWSYHERARRYAELDVKYLQELYPHFDSPALGDDDSELSCMVAAVRWRGFSVDLEGIKKLKVEAKTRNTIEMPPEDVKGKMFLLDVPNKPGWKYFKIPTAPHTARAFIKEKLSDMELLGFEGSDKDIGASTKKTVLEKMAKDKEWVLEDGSRHPAGIRAEQVLKARQADYEADFYGKILLAGRFHASSAITGAKSGRMSGGGSAKGIEGGGRAGGDKLNPQGVKREKRVKEKFGLADGGLILCGGDFAGFEVCLAEAVYNDPDLRKDLQSKRTCSYCKGSLKAKEHECKGEGCKHCTGDGTTCGECKGKGEVGVKIHALFGQFLFPKMTYDEIVASAGTAEDCYEKSKRSFFAVLYGGEGFTINDRVGIPIEIANEALILFGKRYPGVGRHREKIKEMFCSMRQPGGIGSIVEWHEPHEFIESMFGFRRYFTLENNICKALYNLASDPPKEWLDLKIKVVRRERVQTAGGAVRSALFAAAFALQAANMRAAANHEIQSSGAILTKMVQRKIWDVQPPGVNQWLVQPLNVHDEIQCPTHPDKIDLVMKVVNETVELARPKVPLIKMDWQTNLNSWADKG